MEELEKGKVYHVSYDNTQYIYQFTGDLFTVGEDKFYFIKHLIVDSSMHNGEEGKFMCDTAMPSVPLHAKTREAILYEKAWLMMCIEDGRFIEREEVPIMVDERVIDDFFNRKEEEKIRFHADGNITLTERRKPQKKNKPDHRHSDWDCVFDSL